MTCTSPSMSPSFPKIAGLDGDNRRVAAMGSEPYTPVPTSTSDSSWLDFNCRDLQPRKRPKPDRLCLDGIDSLFPRKRAFRGLEDDSEKAIIEMRPRTTKQNTIIAKIATEPGFNLFALPTEEEKDCLPPDN